MLPPIDDAVLRSNPRFAALHSKLTTNILDPNGSTKYQPSQKERDAVTESYNTLQIRSAKTRLIKSALKNLDISPPSQTTTTSRTKTTTAPKPPLPPELLELIILLSAHLSSPPIPRSELSILQNTSQWQSLPTHLPRIASLLSTHLQSQALALVRIQSPTTNASYLHRSIPKLVPAIQTLQSFLRTKTIEIEKRRMDLVSNVTTLLSLFHLAHSLLILHLEQTTHGLLTRHLTARSSYLSLLSQQISLQAREKNVKAEKIIYNDEVKSALETYMRHLRDARERLKERRGQAEKVLWGYGVGRKGEEGEKKEAVMRSIAEKYRELMGELREVGRDVERLRGR